MLFCGVLRQRVRPLLRGLRPLLPQRNGLQDGDALLLQRAHGEREGDAQPVHPDGLRNEQGYKVCPIAELRAARKDHDERDAERVDEYGEQPAEDEFEGHVRAEQPPDPVGAQRGDERTQAPQPDVPAAVAGEHVRKQAPDVQRGDALNIKEREQRQRLGEADLKAQRPVREGAERPGQYAVQRGDDPRAAEHLGGKPLHDSVTSVVFR